jgi:hypothetical protein
VFDAQQPFTLLKTFDGRSPTTSTSSWQTDRA